ncbi:MAG: GNAT family N-acetyltransferase [Gammaproteobacteria bacterium]|nr:GNAT family N-acetyltransferase [Gammaproteobacteria bacterium]
MILRIYLRDKDAAYREQKLAALIKETAPIPLTHYIGELEGHHFAITEFMPGISLRDFLLGDVPHDLRAIMTEVGMILSKITAYEFSKSDFLNKDLEVVPYESSDVIKFAQDCLNNRTVVSVLSPEMIDEIKKAIKQYAYLFSTDDEKHLVHGDFDPANILVDKINDSWVVTGILDWEFAFSGSYLWDVANMLRYAHKMPPEFQNSFIDALQRNAIKLPPDWRTTAHLLNLSSLLDLLKRSDPQRHPSRCADIHELIDHILSELNNMQKIDRVEIKPYDANWPNIFEAEAALIKKALADNCVAIHHVGSTSVPGLAAKPKIDIIAVVRNLVFDKSQLEAIGYKYKGGFNIPLRRSFTIRTADRNINLHVFEENDPEIELNILFRDHLRETPSARDEYALLKYKLIAEESSHEKNNSIYRGYTLGKHDFIQNILKKSGFNKRRFVLCTHHSEWTVAKHFRDTYFFGPNGIEDPYTWTFNHEEHAHLVLYQVTEIVAYAHIQFWPDQRAAIRIIATDENKRNQNSASVFLTLIEKWLRSLGIKSIHAESRQSSLRFYLKNGYTEMPFNDPENHESDPNDVPVGKVL